MDKILTGMKVAVVVANGFCQEDLVETQRCLAQCGANVRIISSENGLVNGWQDDSWGHHFAVDMQLNVALSADYDAVVVPSGTRSGDKLRLTAHTKRFIGGFIATNKPTFVFGDAMKLMVFIDQVRGRKVNCSDEIKDLVAQAGGECCDKTPCADENLMTCDVNADNRAKCIESMSEFFAGYCKDMNEVQAA